MSIFLPKEKEFFQLCFEEFGMKSDEEIDLANVLLKSVEDCKDFYIGFFRRNRYVIDDLLDYREARLQLLETSLDRFILLCDGKVNRHIFEQVFLQSFSTDDIFLIEEAINKGKASLESIFISFQNEPNKNILKNVL